ncbi:efflux RND transporter periplasmic adaptor subunit [Flavobacterium sp. CAU 1735]|uniref:efflux RND transporter periplasmic adaptor subunit n=1 Tax=Flavobacterium sp. CAU 1735 TaxID=3140361 RepID=UPI00325FE37D
MKKQITKWLPTGKVVSLFSVLLFMASCGGKGEEGMGEMGPLETDFIRLTAGEANVTNTYPGSIEGSVNVDIKAQVTGYLETVYVKEGDYVEKGQRLFRIKDEVFQEQVANSDAGLKAAVAAQASAKIELEKLKPLVDGKVVSDIQLKEAQARYSAATAQVAQAKATLGSSKINADFTLIKAPVSGFIGRIPNRIGNLVTPADATPLTTLSEINTVSVYFSMSESDYIAYKKETHPKESVSLILADGSTYEHKGKLETASGNIDRTTGSMPMKALFVNPDKLLRSGGTGRVVIDHTKNSVIQIPRTSVKDIQDKFFVFKLADSNKVVMLPIQISGNSSDSFLVKSGVQTGDKIAINRIDALTEGMAVIPKIIKTSNTTQQSDNKK